MGDDGADGAGEGEGEHDEAGRKNVVLVARGDAIINDVGHESGQAQGAVSLSREADEQENNLPPIWLKIFQEFEHKYIYI